jgi:RNA polymerase sigma-70 factor, ECF subfamily
MEMRLAPEQEQNLKPECATRFVELLTAHQRKLYAYICTLMFGDAAAIDVLQETNLALWSRANEYDFERPFLPWAFGFARNRIADYRRSQSRSRRVFTEDVLNAIDEDCAIMADSADVRLLALRKCLNKLNHHQAQLIRDRYASKMSVKTMAAQLGSTAVNIATQLFRTRKVLAKCIEATLATEER